MLCAQIEFFQYLKQGLFAPPSYSDINEGAKQDLCVIFLKYCKTVVNVQNMLTYFRLSCFIAYIFN